MHAYDLLVARTALRSALIRTGVSQDVASAMARGFDPDAGRTAAEYLMRLVDRAERAADSLHAPTACELRGAGAR